MWKATAKATDRGMAKQRWVPKGSETKAEPPVEAAPLQEVVSQASKDTATKETAASPVLSEQSGPSYDRMMLLRIYEKFRGDGAAQPTEKAVPAEVPAAEENQVEELCVALKERPAAMETAESARQPGTRRALREQKKAEKAAKRASSGIIEEAEEQEATEQPEVPQPETPTAQRIELLQELQAAAQVMPMLPDNAALMMYLNSMAFAPPLPTVYGAAGYPGYTTVMLRNIPNRYTRDMLVDRLNKGYEGQYDFVYLPIDFSSQCNVGYAFINFRTPAIAQRFIQEFHGAKTKHCLPGFSSAKVCEVSYARVQGRDANMDNLRDDKFIEKLIERPEWQPLFFDDAGNEVPFTSMLGTGGRRRASRSNSLTGASPQGTPSLGPAAAPTLPPPAGGFMMPTPFGPVMYPPFGALPQAPQATLKSVLPAATSSTMLMLRGVPTALTREQLIEHLNKSYRGAYDFLFLPGDAASGGNRGFAFVNFRSAKKAQQFTKEHHDVKASSLFPGQATDESKVCQVTGARLDSVEKSIERAQSGPLAKIGAAQADQSAWLPLSFGTDAEPAPFPHLGAAAAVGSKVPAAAGVGPLRPVPAQALDSRALEMKMKMEAGSTGPSAPSGKPKQQRAPPPPPAAPAGGLPIGLPGGYPGYLPGFPGLPHPAVLPHAAYAAAHAAAVAQAAAAAHLTAHAAAAAHAVHIGGLLDPLAAAVNPRDGQPLSTEQRAALRKQIEYYYSTENLCKDMYLRSHMDESGWTPLELLAQFPQVRKHRATMPEITEALADSTVLEVDSTVRRVRLKDEETRKKWSRVA